MDKSRQLEIAEREAWRDLCAMLKAAGAVTESDLEQRTSYAGTPGCRLLIFIREWGSLYARLTVANVRR